MYSACVAWCALIGKMESFVYGVALKKTGWCRGLKSCWRRSQGNIMSQKSSIVKFFVCVSGVSVLVLDSVSVFVDVSVFVVDVKVIV